MNFALEHNLGAKTVFPNIDVFSNRERKQLQLFDCPNRGLLTPPDVNHGPYPLIFI
jgi:hypothetical protein